MELYEVPEEAERPHLGGWGVALQRCWVNSDLDEKLE